MFPPNCQTLERSLETLSCSFPTIKWEIECQFPKVPEIISSLHLAWRTCLIYFMFPNSSFLSYVLEASVKFPILWISPSNVITNGMAGIHTQRLDPSSCILNSPQHQTQYVDFHVAYFILTTTALQVYPGDLCLFPQWRWRKLDSDK